MAFQKHTRKSWQCVPFCRQLGPITTSSLSEKLKPLSTNEHTIDDIFSFADDLPEVEISDHDILVSCDVSALFTNVPVDETTEILVSSRQKPSKKIGLIKNTTIITLKQTS